MAVHARRKAGTISPMPSARTLIGSRHVLLYAGLDRFDNSGDARRFWFSEPSRQKPGSHLRRPFTGTHAAASCWRAVSPSAAQATIKVFAGRGRATDLAASIDRTATWRS